MTRIRNCKCKNCHIFFKPDPHNAKKQQFCKKPECRNASKKESQRKWLNKPENVDYFRGSANVERVQQWRAEHPGYGHKKVPQDKDALQDLLIQQMPETYNDSDKFQEIALQDLLIAQPYVLLGLIANITGNALQDDMDFTLRRLQKLGRDIAAHHINSNKGGQNGVETSYPAPTSTACAPAIQLGGPSAGP